MTTSKIQYYASDYTLSVTESCIIILCFLLRLPTGGDRARQTLPGEWEATVFYIREIKNWDETCLIIVHNLPYCISLLCCFMHSWAPSHQSHSYEAKHRSLQHHDMAHIAHEDLKIRATLENHYRLYKTFLSILNDIVVLQRTQKSYFSLSQ